jgi:regulatory protein
MSETIVERKPRPHERVFLRLSGGRFFTVPQSEAEILLPGTALAEEDITRLSRIDQYVRGRDKALRMLAIRSRSRHELENALAALEISPEVRRGVLEELRDLGLVDDERFAREFVGARVDLKRLGPHRLKFELRKLGVAPAIVERALEEAFPAGRQEELARAAAGKRLGSRVPQERDVRRISDFLKRKGFDYGVVNRVAYELLKRAGSGAAETASDEEPQGHEDE